MNSKDFIARLGRFEDWTPEQIAYLIGELADGMARDQMRRFDGYWGAAAALRMASAFVEHGDQPDAAEVAAAEIGILARYALDSTFWGSVEHEIYRRAQEGWEEPIYGGRHKEKIVGTVRRYSDRLLELRAKALLPAYREVSSVSVNGRVTHNLDAGVLGDAVARVAVQMAESLRAALPAPVRVIDHEPG